MRGAIISFFMLCSLAGGSVNPNSYKFFPFEHFQKEFQNYFITTPGTFNTIHDTTTVGCKEEKWCHIAYVLSRHGNTNCSDTTNPACQRERGYPTIEVQKDSGGFNNVFQGPLYIRFWLWTNAKPKVHHDGAGTTDDWFSQFTATHDTSNRFDSVVTLEVSPDGFQHWQHVPLFGQDSTLFQADSINHPELKLPLSQWVRDDVFINPDPTNGYVKLWQNGSLVSYAKLHHRHNQMAQFHFGLYASPAMGPPGDSLTVKNDGVFFQSVSSEAEVQECFLATER